MAKVNWATVPSAMVFWFNPKTTHIAEPLAVVHVRALPAEFADEPMVAVRPAISVGEYWRVHCNAAGWVPPAESARLRVTLLPGAPTPDPSVKLADCP